MNDISILELKNVYKQFHNKMAIENLSFTVNKNDIFGFLGPNGAGKTTTIRLMLNLLTPDQGNILINGKKVNGKNIRKVIGVCLDNEGLYENMTCRENLEFYDRIYNRKQGRRERIEKLIQKVGLIDAIDKKVFEFSKGMKKRLGIARAIINNPEIVILDEPLSGLDPEGQELVKNIIKELSQNSTIFFSSHNLSDVQDICNRIAIIDTTLIKFGEVSDLIQNESKELIITLSNDSNYEEMKFLNSVNEIIKFDIKDKILNIVYKEDLDIGAILSDLNRMNLKVLNVENKAKTVKDVYFETMKGAEQNV